MQVMLSSAADSAWNMVDHLFRRQIRPRLILTCLRSHRRHAEAGAGRKIEAFHTGPLHQNRRA